MRAWFFRHPRVMRFIMNLWPPFFFCGIVIEDISSDFRQASVALKWRPWNLNANGSQYGGNLFSMTDPVYPSLLLALLGWERYYVWDKGAIIDYVAPGRGKVFFKASVSQKLLNNIIEHTKTGEKYQPWIEGDIIDKEGKIIAHVKRQLYIRMRKEYRTKVVG